MKKILSFSLVCLMVILSAQGAFAQDFSGREDEMNRKCALIEDVETQKECIAYKEYLEQKKSGLDKELADIDKKLADVKGNMEELTKKIKENNGNIEDLTKSIKGVEESINDSQTHIKKLTKQIKVKENDIKVKDKLMKDRLVDLQPYIGNNQVIDFLMGSKSFADLLRRGEVITQLNSYESDQIEQLNKEKKEIILQKDNVEYQKQVLESQKESLKGQKQKEEALKNLNEKLMSEYRKQEQELFDEQVKAQMARTSIPNVDTTLVEKIVEPPKNNHNNNSKPIVGTDQVVSSGSLICPLKGTWHYSAGTWAYPDGSVHRGMDMGTYATQGLRVVAPASGIILWAYDGCPSPSGNNYPNSCGIPYTTGNNVLLLTSVDGIVYAIPMYHLSQVHVSSGELVSQGQLLGLSGNSGNSTGPHLHVEIIKVGKMSLKQAIAQYNSTQDLSFGVGWGVDPIPCGEAPCRLRPESYWLK